MSNHHYLLLHHPHCTCCQVSGPHYSQ